MRSGSWTKPRCSRAWPPIWSRAGSTAGGGAASCAAPRRRNVSPNFSWTIPAPARPRSNGSVPRDGRSRSRAPCRGLSRSGWKPCSAFRIPAIWRRNPSKIRRSRIPIRPDGRIHGHLPRDRDLRCGNPDPVRRTNPVQPRNLPDPNPGNGDRIPLPEPPPSPESPAWVSCIRKDDPFLIPDRPAAIPAFRHRRALPVGLSQTWVPASRLRSRAVPNGLEYFPISPGGSRAARSPTGRRVPPRLRSTDPRPRQIRVACRNEPGSWMAPRRSTRRPMAFRDPTMRDPRDSQAIPPWS